MRRLILGTAGHIDHGKTALVHALTGTDTDRLPEEKQRGITIDLGFAALALPTGAQLSIVDVPGHDAFVRNMLAGATGIDLGLLVIAADEGVMPQTREHLAILELLGIPAIIVALTKCDLVEDDWLDLVRDEVDDLLADGPFAASSIVPVSARSGAGLDVLRDVLDSAAASVTLRRADDAFRLPIDRVFTIQGTGTVVTGTVWSGSITRDASVTIMPGERTVRLRGLQAHGQERPSAGPGERAALALAGTARHDLERGMSVVTGTGWTAAAMLTVRLRVLASSPPVRTRQRVRFHLGTAEALGRVVVLGAPLIEPGEVGWAQLRLEQPIVARARDHFVVRSYSPVTTIAGGIVAEPAAAKRRRLQPGDAALLESLLTGDSHDALAALLANAGWSGVARASLPILLGVPTAAVDDAVDAACGRYAAVQVGSRLFQATLFDSATRLVLDRVDEVHRVAPLRAGVDRDELRRALPPHAPPDLAEHVLAVLVDNGTLVPARAALRRADHQPALTPGQQAAVDGIARLLVEAGLAPPTTGELAAAIGEAHQLPDLLRYLEDRGTIVPLRHDLYIATEALAAAIDRVRATGQQSPMTPAEFRDIFGITRKHLIPLLEYLDRAGVTVRHGDARRVNPL